MADEPPNPSLSTVVQPGPTSVQPPADLKARLKQSYNEVAPAYNQWTTGHNNLRMDYTARLIKLLQTERSKNGASPDPDAPSTLVGIHLPPSLRGTHALEVGCGAGIPVVEILLAKDMDVMGVDLSGAQLALARGHFPDQTAAGQVVWDEHDMMELRFPPDEFTVVVGLYSLIHLPREEQTVFLHRAFRWLKPGGMMLINFAKEETEGEVMEEWLGKSEGWMYWSSWGEEKMMQIITGLGMEVLVQETTEDELDSKFVWVIARKN
jgi:2-polyprenyl-3-methyl-5-hydroxy-6-metoxy-1,4-benzoquinol methylase